MKLFVSVKMSTCLVYTVTITLFPSWPSVYYGTVYYGLLYIVYGLLYACATAFCIL